MAKPKKSKQRSVKAEREQYARDVLCRGEAAEVEPGKALPPGVTHKILSKLPLPGKVPAVKRVRFSAY